MNYECSSTIRRQNGNMNSPCIEESKHEGDPGWNCFLFFLQSWYCVYKEFSPHGRTVSHTFYKDVLERLWKWVKVWKYFAGDWVLYHNNMPAHTVLLVWEFMAKKNFPSFHISLQLRSALCDFFLFYKVKLKL